MRLLPQIFNKSEYDAELAHVRDLRLWTNEFAQTGLAYMASGPPTFLPESRFEYGCMFKQLFRPTAALEAAVRQQLQGMFGSPEGPEDGYVAMHLRLGGAVGGRLDGRLHGCLAAGLLGWRDGGRIADAFWHELLRHALLQARRPTSNSGMATSCGWRWRRPWLPGGWAWRAASTSA